MTFWHLHQDWTLEVHEDGPGGPCGQVLAYSPPECKIIAKLGPEDSEAGFLVEAHNANVRGERAKSWGEAFAELHGV